MAYKHANRIDMRFVYEPAASTNISKRFARERARLKEEAARKLAEAEAEKAAALDIEAEVQRKVRRLAK